MAHPIIVFDGQVPDEKNGPPDGVPQKVVTEHLGTTSELMVCPDGKLIWTFQAFPSGA